MSNLHVSFTDDRHLCGASSHSFLHNTHLLLQTPMAGILCELDREINLEIEKLLSRNIWMLSADSATSKDHRLFTIDAVNEDNLCVHVKTVHSSWASQNAEWLKDNLKEVADKVAYLAGLAQDSAATCKKAFRMLHSELPACKRSSCFEIVCCEHQAQLLNQDIAKAIPWLKDCPVGMAAASQSLCS